MATLTADSQVQQWLQQVQDISEIRDDQGNLLGIFTPKEKTEDWIYEQARNLFNPQELDRRVKEEHGQGISFAEVMRHLHSLEGKA